MAWHATATSAGKAAGQLALTGLVWCSVCFGTAAILGDLCGPKVRVGMVKGNGSIELVEGATVVVKYRWALSAAGKGAMLWLPAPFPRLDADDRVVRPDAVTRKLFPV